MRVVFPLLITLAAAHQAAAFAPSSAILPLGHTRASTASITGLRCASGEMGSEAKPSRRSMVSAAAIAAAFGAAASSADPAVAASAGPKKDDAWWKEKLESGTLSKRAYAVLHNADTEMPRTSALLKEARAGVYVCAACKTPTFASETKFDSGTGWPSFYEKLDGVELETGNIFDNVVALRSEVHCKTCGGHLGHVFDDGLMWRVPTGKRYCINGIALGFQPS
eukprot:CAMPEP_0173393326 /NCGR_PEP_ID=MMETSP1356-20130122/22048_1 /TAXON_ID=77927 ORGANISM="Hemiselmis virescens, Strain PCC157" /NCGR_SAMPLE_ID=MMETSP1356 /ASSEMBLY_ACC=CAM_ASM_000847 /LENGTH=222 /DNA_ID=CAMNT_0014351331 /DNA_START=137 /DNA_END=805 /DNA_ORIENTATION=-